MKLKCSASKLNATLSLATRVCSPKAAMPILSCVRLKADGRGRVYITGNNLDLSISASLPAVVDEPGSICIQGRRFNTIVSALPQDDTTLFASAKHHLDVKNGCSHFKLMGQGAEEFPDMKDLPDNAVELKFTQAALKTSLLSVSSAKSDDPTRYILNSTMIEVKDGKLSFVATDGRRMHANCTGLDKSGEHRIVVPANTVDKLLSILSDEGGVTLSFSKSQIKAVVDREDGEIQLISKLVEGNFPNWRQVVPEFAPTDALEVNRKDLLGALKRVRLALDEKNTSIKLKLEGLGLELSANSANDKADETVMCKNPGNLSGQIAVNASFVAHALEGVDAELVRLHLSKDKMEISPLCISTADCTMVIMPVRLT